MTAVCARSLASRSAVPPSVHPKVEKPSTVMTTAPITAPQIPGFKLGGNLRGLIAALPTAPLHPPRASIVRDVGTVGAPKQYVRPRMGRADGVRSGASEHRGYQSQEFSEYVASGESGMARVPLDTSTPDQVSLLTQCTLR